MKLINKETIIGSSIDLGPVRFYYNRVSRVTWASVCDALEGLDYEST